MFLILTGRGAEVRTIAVLSGWAWRTLFLFIETLSVTVRAPGTGLPVEASASRAVIAHGTDGTLSRDGAVVALRTEVAVNRERVVHLNKKMAT